MTNILNERMSFLIRKFKEIFDYIEIEKETHFLISDGYTFVLTPKKWANKDLIIIEYGETLKTPRTQYFDGDSYYLLDYNEDEMFEQMLNDINK